MGITVAERKKREREATERAWEAEQERVRKLGDLFSVLPGSPQKDALLDAMTDRVIDLYNNVKFEQGDAILEFMPNDYARRLLDWYFDEDAPDVAPDFRRSARDERPSPSGVAGQPDGAQTEASPDVGATPPLVESEASEGQSLLGTEGCGCAQV